MAAMPNRLCHKSSQSVTRLSDTLDPMLFFIGTSNALVLFCSAMQLFPTEGNLQVACNSMAGARPQRVLPLGALVLLVIEGAPGKR